MIEDRADRGGLGHALRHALEGPLTWTDRAARLELALPSAFKATLVGLAIVAFISVRGYIIYSEFRDRPTPIEPDDAYRYMLQIERFARVGLRPLPIERWSKAQPYLAWSAIWGTLRWVVFAQLPIEQVYAISFYVGIVLLAGALAFFFYRLAGWDCLVVGLLTMLSYHGSGAWHGFYWVTPSFYLFMWTALALGLIIGQRPEPATGPPPSTRGGLEARIREWTQTPGVTGLAAAGALVVLTHAMGLVALAAFILMLGFDIALRQRSERGRVARTVAFCVGGVLALAFYQLATAGSTTASHGAFLASTVKRRVTIGEWQSRLSEEQADWTFVKDWLSLYVYHFIAPRYKAFVFGVPALIGAGMLIRQRRTELPSLLAGFMLLALIGTLYKSELGRRIFLWVWPLTYMVAAYGYLTLARVVFALWREGRAKRAVSVGLAILSLVAFGLNTYHDVRRGLSHVRGMQAAHFRYHWDPTCADFLLEQTSQDDVVVYTNRLTANFWVAHGLAQRPIEMASSLSPDSIQPGRNVYYVCPTRNIFDEINYCPGGEVGDQKLDSIQPLRLARRCGDFDIYRARADTEVRHLYNICEGG